MAFCSKCGKPLNEDAKFCASCGTPVESMNSDTSEQRKQIFVGSIRKCPNCGQQITSDTAKCPSCGFIIEKKNVSGALDLFVKKLTSISDDNEKREFIETYAIPNNKEDIRDLLTYAASQRDKTYEYPQDKVFWVDAWNNKCKHILNQAFDTFEADREFAAYLKEYQEGVVKSAEENEALKRRLFSIKASEERKEAFKKYMKGFFIFLIVLAIFGGVGFGIRSCSIKRTENKKFKKEKQKILNESFSISKENIQLGGLIGEYFIPDSECIIKFRNAEPAGITYVGFVEHNISFKIKAINNDFGNIITNGIDSKKKEMEKIFNESSNEYEFVRVSSPKVKVQSNYGDGDSLFANIIGSDSLKSVVSQMVNAKKDDVIIITMNIRDTAISSDKKTKKSLEEAIINLHESKEFTFSMSFEYQVEFQEKNKENPKNKKEYVYF